MEGRVRRFGARALGRRRRVRRRRGGAGRRRRFGGRRREGLQARPDRRRQGRRVLHHDELRRAGEGEGARRQPRVPGPRPVRRLAADADRQRRRGEEAGRDPDRADRHEGDVRADQAAGRRGLEDRPRRHDARAARPGGVPDRVRQRGRRPRGRDGARRADRRLGQGVRRSTSSRASRPPTRARRASRRARRRPAWTTWARTSPTTSRRRPPRSSRRSSPRTRTSRASSRRTSSPPRARPTACARRARAAT